LAAPVAEDDALSVIWRHTITGAAVPLSSVIAVYRHRDNMREQRRQKKVQVADDAYRD
jgi:hypothetical protein